MPKQLDLLTDGLADRMADDIIEQLTSQGLSHGQQQAFVARLVARQTLEQVRQWPKPCRELFLLLIVEGLTDDYSPGTSSDGGTQQPQP